MPTLSDADISKLDAQQNNQQSQAPAQNAQTAPTQAAPAVLSDADIANLDKQTAPKVLSDADISKFDNVDTGSIAGNMKAGQNPVQATWTQVAQHPFRSAFQGLPETVTGSTLEQDANNLEQSPSMGQSATKPFDKNLGTVVPESMALTTAAQVGDMATAPINAVAGPIIHGAANITEKALAPMFRGLAGHGDVYRNMLNPGKGVIDDVEVKSGKDIDDSFQKMADERLPIQSTIQNGRDTLDTNLARAQVKGQISAIDDSLTNYLNNSDAQFNLNDLRDQTLKKLRASFKNDDDLESAQNEVNLQFDAAIRQRVPGYDPEASDAQNDFIKQNDPNAVNEPVVNAATLNDMKKGMWQKGYNLLAPNAQKTSRIIGNTLKTAIEDAHPDDSMIKDLNQESGQLQTVDAILQKSHGKVVNGGALANYLRGGVGAIVGEQIGALMGHPMIGTGAGAMVGEHLNRFLNNPEMITSVLSKIRDLHDFGGSVADASQDIASKFGNGVTNAFKGAPESVGGEMTPEVMGGKALPYSPKIGLHRAIPSPQKAGQSSGPVINQKGYTPLGLPEAASPTARNGVEIPAGKGLPSPRVAGQSSGPVIRQEPIDASQVKVTPKALPKPSTAYGEGFTMRDYKPEPINLSDSDRKDLGDMLDWTANQQNGERYSFINDEGQRQFSGSPSGHAESVQEIGPKPAQDLMRKALINKPLTPMQQLKVNKMLKDYQTNIKPKMSGDGDVEGNTDTPQENPPLGPNLKGNKGSANSILSPLAATGAALGLAMGANKANASQDDQDRLKLPAAQYTKNEEGFTKYVKTDAKGTKEVGHGFNSKNPAIWKLIPENVKNGSAPLDPKLAEKIYPKAYNIARNDAIQFVGNRTWNNMSARQQKGLADMSYAMGLSTLNGFRRLKVALQSSNWGKASQEVLNSDYGRNKGTRGRAGRNAELMKNNG